MNDDGSGAIVPPACWPAYRGHMSRSEPVEPSDSLEEAAESWLRREAAAAYDALKEDPGRVTPAEVVRARFEGKWSQG